MLSSFLKLRKIRAPIKIKSAPPPPKTPPQKRGILRTWFFLQKERIFPGVHKIGAPISGPRIAGNKNLRTRAFFWEVQALKALVLPGESRMGFFLHLHATHADTAKSRQQPLAGPALRVWPTSPANRLQDGPMTWLHYRPGICESGRLV